MNVCYQSNAGTFYRHPKYHVSYMAALARRVRSNYLWILLIQTVAYCGKLMVHPAGVKDWQDFVTRADVGPIPGEMVLALGAVYILTWLALAVWITRVDLRRARERGGTTSMG